MSNDFFLLYLFDNFPPFFVIPVRFSKTFVILFLALPDVFQMVWLYIFVIGTCLFIKIFVIPMFVIPNFRYNKIKAKIDKIEDKTSIVYVIKVNIIIYHSRFWT